VTFLIGCAVLLLVVGCAGTSSEAPQEEKQGHTEATKQQARSPEATASEEARCEGTRTYHLYNVSYTGGGEGPLRTGSEEDMKKADKKASHDYKWGVKTQDFGVYTTNDLPGCPKKGGLLKGTDKADKLGGKDGDDEIRGLGDQDVLYSGPGDDEMLGGEGNDVLWGEAGSDVLYGGPGADSLYGGSQHSGCCGKDVLYGGDGNDFLGARDGQRDKFYCGEGKDIYLADKIDYVDSSCEKKEVGGEA
jgi:hypothetical protein